MSKINDLLAQVAQEAYLIKTEYEEQEAKLGALKSDVAQMARERKSALNGVDRARSDMISIKEDLEALKKQAAGERVKLEAEIADLNEKKAQLMIANNKLVQQNTKFIQYEAEAKKKLLAFEESLLLREKVVQERESLRPKNAGII